MRSRNHWSYPRSATAMWNAKCFMKIEMGNICAKFSRLRKTKERIEVCTIYIHLATGIVDCAANLTNSFFKYAMLCFKLAIGSPGV